VTIRTVNATIAAENDLAVNSGAVIIDVVSGSPADEAGLEPYDVIVAADGEAITTNSQLVRNIQGRAPGSQVAFTVYRGTQELTITVTLGSTPEPTS
jgi:S1-C subfamily serine protease